MAGPQILNDALKLEVFLGKIRHFRLGLSLSVSCINFRSPLLLFFVFLEELAKLLVQLPGTGLQKLIFLFDLLEIRLRILILQIEVLFLPVFLEVLVSLLDAQRLHWLSRPHPFQAIEIVVLHLQVREGTLLGGF